MNLMHLHSFRRLTSLISLMVGILMVIPSWAHPPTSCDFLMKELGATFYIHEGERVKPLSNESRDVFLLGSGHEGTVLRYVPTNGLNLFALKKFRLPASAQNFAVGLEILRTNIRIFSEEDGRFALIHAARMDPVSFFLENLEGQTVDFLFFFSWTNDLLVKQYTELIDQIENDLLRLKQNGQSMGIQVLKVESEYSKRLPAVFSQIAVTDSKGHTHEYEIYVHSENVLVDSRGRMIVIDTR